MTISATAPTVFANLRNAIAAQYEERLNNFIGQVKEENDVWGITDKWQYKELFTASKKYTVWVLSDLQNYLIERKRKALNKELEKELLHLTTVEKAPALVEMKISVEWKKNRTWGSNPTCEAWIRVENDSHYYNSGSIGGCGYDKLSTAVANAVNQDNSFLRAMYAIKEQNVTTKNHELFGYGSGYGVLPRLEGGVGVSCYPSIFEKIGFKFNSVASGKTYDIYNVSK